jgi:hypothetical protein
MPKIKMKIKTDLGEIKKTPDVKKVKDIKKVKEDKKKRVKDCIGNRFHDEDTGQFTSKDKAGSSSIRKKNNDNCQPGTTRSNPNRWISNVQRCGRLGPYKCSTDQLAEIIESGDIFNKLYIDDEVKDGVADRLERIVDADPEFLSNLAYLVQPIVDYRNKNVIDPAL